MFEAVRNAPRRDDAVSSLFEQHLPTSQEQLVVRH
jgi:hypothetical protein